MTERFTVGDLREALKGFENNVVIHFEGGLTFSYVKIHGRDDADNPSEIVIRFEGMPTTIPMRTIYESR
jgi:hypothetical protein